MKVDLETVKSAVSVIPEIAACYLFGSAAKGEPAVNDIRKNLIIE